MLLCLVNPYPGWRGVWGLRVARFWVLGSGDLSLQRNLIYGSGMFRAYRLIDFSGVLGLGENSWAPCSGLRHELLLGCGWSFGLPGERKPKLKLCYIMLIDWVLPPYSNSL